MTGKQLAAVSLLSAVAAVGAAAATGCTRAQVGEVTTGQAKYDVTTLEFSNNTSRAVSPDDLPQDVQAMVRTQFPNATITGVEDRKYLGGQHYYRVHVAEGEGPNRVEKQMDYNSGAGR